MRKENSEFNTAFVSEAGSFLKNRDFYGCVELEDWACYVMADGLDTDTEVNSAQITVQTILESFLDKPTMSKRRLTEYIKIAHEWLQYESRRVRLKAGFVIVVTDYTRMVWASAGHTRLYHFRGNRIALKSKDHSVAARLAVEGQIAEDRVDQHDERGNLNEYAGKPGMIKPYVSDKIKLADGDVLVLCTPGMWEGVQDAEMIDAVEGANDPQTLADTLEEVMLSKQRARIENYSAAAIYVNKIFHEEPKNRKKWIKRIAIMLIMLLIFGGAGIFYAVKSAAKKAELVVDMLQYEQNADQYVKEQEYAKAVSDYSLARNNSIKVKDPIHKKLFTEKMAAAQTLVDGDAHLKEGDITKATASYTKALELTESYSMFNREVISERLEQMTTFQQVQDWITEGDLKLQNGDYSGAIILYKRARTAATETAYKDALKEIATKLETAETKRADIKRQSRQLQADTLEQKGDRFNEAGDYAGALTAYEKAQEIYQEIDMLERVLAMERKINKLDEKLNPPVPAADLNTDTAGFGSADMSGMNTDLTNNTGGVNTNNSVGSSSSNTPNTSNTSNTSNTTNGDTNSSVGTGATNAVSNNTAEIESEEQPTTEGGDSS
ncbi:serine/threonine protein phosphatase PrpC/predicted negative regulator of RcsB-dependent stress response [Paenibacillus amylolyticus]|uniref:Serine/threonine protein phosphatase PrpC/predicted negative regulator of RcsB-dependent stress response n=1 Tax=Paenibacillus amylolyticus TaxID=1451 RepID=A0AAP5GZZ6_PAEAM|nr:serine/threonine protein phosphatase [Paenibacillus amylolyticus]MDR6723272.1 serine/threonine protein phosphatase PrpC/predicted negative regulator of RcsB-dependent stress response [Paenibacillus amylolyticus]